VAFFSTLSPSIIMTIQSGIDLLFKTLKEMDVESPWGLRGWVDYVSMNLQAEVAITDTLETRLTEKGLPTKHQVKYPYSTTGSSSDLRLVLDDGRFWIEAKVDYTVWGVGGIENIQRPTKHMFSPFVSDWNNKLSKLRISDARYIGALLMGFDAIEYPYGSQEIVEKVESKLHRPWTKRTESWNSFKSDLPYKARTNLWLWYRELPETN
jgi:hypothetical protein